MPLSPCKHWCRVCIGHNIPCATCPDCTTATITQNARRNAKRIADKHAA